MTSRRIKSEQTVNNSIDYFNFCNANNDLPVLRILNERFNRLMRITFSNHLRMIITTDFKESKIIFKNWIEHNSNLSFMFVVSLQKLGAPILIKLDRILAYRMIDILTGGPGVSDVELEDKEITTIEIGLLREICLKLINDLNEAWGPVCEIKASYVRAEVNAQFIGFAPSESKMIKIDYNICFNNTVGTLEVLYPYSTLFPLRNELFASI